MRHLSLAAVCVSLAFYSSVAAQVATKDVPWHVPQADVRYPVAVDANWQAPVETYLADLIIKGGKDLIFDPATKAARTRDLGDKKSGKPLERVKGDAVFEIKPGFQWFTFRTNGKVLVQAGATALTARQLPDKVTYHVALPPGASSLRVEVDADYLVAAGLLSSGPKVAQTVLCLPGQDPTQLTPIVVGDDGKQVGAVTLWATAGEPMVVLFDSSAGRANYFIYPVENTLKVARPQWFPEAGLIFETRYLDDYDPRVKTLEGFLDLWKQSDYVACKMSESDILRGFLPAAPRQAATRIKSAPRGAPLALSRYVGHIRLPADDEYRFHFRAWQGGFLTVDGQPIIELSPAEAGSGAHKVVAIKLAAGAHRIEVHQYGQYGQFYVSLGWSSLIHKQPRIFGQGLPIFDPIIAAPVQDLQVRDSSKAIVSFAWPYRGDRPWRQCFGQGLAEDVVGWRLSARTPLTPLPPGEKGKGEGVEYRWRFEDGRSAKGKDIDAIFCRTGMQKVTLEMLDAKTEKLLARCDARINVHIRPDWPEGHSFHLLAEGLKKNAGEFAALTPIDELLSLHAWACQFRRPDLRGPLGDALVTRLDQALASASDARLLALARAFIEPEERRYHAAEKLLRAALLKAPSGSSVRQHAALTLGELLTEFAGKPQEALDLLDKVAAEPLEVDLVNGWKVAFDPMQRKNIAAMPVAEVLPLLKWDPEPRRLPIRYSAKDSEALWLAKDLNLTAANIEKPLTLDFGGVASHSPTGAMPAPGMVWFNNQPLGEPWRAPFVVPTKLLHPGSNQVVVCMQAPAAPEFYRAAAPPAFDILGVGRGEDLSPRFQQERAEALLHLGKFAEAGKALQTLPAKSWPLTEIERVRLLGQLRIIQRLAAGAADDPLNARDQLDVLLGDYPQLRLDAEVMQARVETHLGLKEYPQAFLLAKQMLGVKEQGELTRRQYLLGQVRAAGALEDFELARAVYKQLADLSPYSPETVRAREAIIRAAERQKKE